jgi:acid stress-induced BolA-like protein IbaG/YrbA
MPSLPLRRQQLVYKSIWLELQDAVHAVDAMTTKTPAEAGLS